MWTGAGRVCGVALVLVAACARVFGIEDASVRGASVGGRAGTTARSHAGAGQTASHGGAPAAGGGGKTSRGGARNGGRGDEAAGQGGEDTGGASGDAGASSMTATDGGSGAEAATGGAAGETPPAGTVRLGASCSNEEKSACGDASPLVVLRCKNGVWIYDHSCALDYRCDPASDACVELDGHCFDVAPDGPVCDGNSVFDCSPELWTAEEQVCPYGCRDGACMPGSASQLTLHTRVLPAQSAWQQSIPVCLAASNTDASAEFDLVRGEIDSVYNRFLGVEFFGWHRCARDAAGVELSFDDDCSGHLVNDVAPVGSDSGALVHVSLCKSYLDSAGQSQHASPALLRLLARHQFGHVLGLADGTDAQVTGMLRGVESGHEDDVVLTPEDYLALWDYPLLYPRKPGHSLVTPGGECVTPSSLEPGATVTLAACDPSSTGPELDAVADRIQSPSGSFCFSAGTAGNAVSTATCALGNSPSQTFQLARAQWRTPVQCVAPADRPAAAGSKLGTEPCAAVGDANQAWWFEIVGTVSSQTYVRIHFGDSGFCAAAPAVSIHETLELAACDGATDTSDPELFSLLTDGTLMAGSLRVRWQNPAGLLYLDQDWSLYTQFFASGALERPDGTALCVLPGSTLGVAVLTEPPAPNQVFDIYFSAYAKPSP